MFNLGDGNRYWLYNEPTDMRKSFFTLSGLVTNNMGHDPLSGDVYIFINRGCNRIKLLHMEPGGLVIYSKMLDVGRFHAPKSDKTHQITWRALVIMIEGIIENPHNRRKRLKEIKYK